jgi:hypothetical protein
MQSTSIFVAFWAPASHRSSFTRELLDLSGGECPHIGIMAEREGDNLEFGGQAQSLGIVIDASEYALLISMKLADHSTGVGKGAEEKQDQVEHVLEEDCL